MTYNHYLRSRGIINNYVFRVLSRLNPCFSPFSDGRRCGSCDSCRFICAVGFSRSEEFISSNFSDFHYEGVLPE